VTVEGAAVDEDAAKAFTVAIGKVQFVQIYLEDSSLPLSIEQHPESKTPAPCVTMQESGTHSESPLDTSMTMNKEEAADDKKPVGPHFEAALNATPPRSTTQMGSTSIVNSTPRPALAQSSFSWMLDAGIQEPQPKEPRTPAQSRQSARSTFVSGSPFTPASPSNTGSARKQDLDFLFGSTLAADEDITSTRRDSVSRKTKDEHRSKKKTEETIEGEVYKLNTMRGKGKFDSTA